MLISIITINLNNVIGLKKTMDSIFMQSSSSFEWIVIDGGSSDGSVTLLNNNRTRIDYWVSEPDRGLYHAMNKGISVAKGEYLLFLNSGDSFASSDVISSFIEKHFSSDVVYGNAIFVDENNHEIRRFEASNFIRLSNFWHKGGLNHQATFFDKRCFDSFRYNETTRIASDTELFMMLLYHGFRFEKWDYFIVRYEAGGISSIIKEGDYKEFSDMVNRVLPPGVKADYDEIIQNRDVDLYITIRRIIASKRWVRNLARLALLPFRLFLG